MKNIFYLFILVSCSSIFTNTAITHSYLPHKTPLKAVFYDQALFEKFLPFVPNVLQQCPASQFQHVVSELLGTSPFPLEDKEIYEYLLNHASALRSFIPPLSQLKALRTQQALLGAQATHLLESHHHIQGYVEIGGPCRYLNALKKTKSISGLTYAVHDRKRITDAIESPSFNIGKRFAAYDIFIPLDNYNVAIAHEIPASSVDLVVCFIGLHHIPPEKIESFITDIYTILRPGGIFLLRDHDAYNEELFAIASAAHSVFNALIAQETPLSESQEIRNFRPLSHWIELLEKQGFTTAPERLLQQGDPTLNTMIRFTKGAHTEQDAIAQITHELHHKKEYMRDITQGMLTVPEWHDVDRSQAYGQFINHTPFYEYPYFKNITSYWNVFGKSFALARTRTSPLSLLASQYTLMNLFIGISTSLEYAIKGAISLPIRLAIGGAETATIAMLVQDKNNEICINNSGIQVLQAYPYDLKLIQLPRYKEFLSTLQSLSSTAVKIIEIAGQKEIQIKVRYKKENDLLVALLPHQYSKAYEWVVPTIDYTYAAILVPTKELLSIIRTLASSSVELIYVHDF